MFFILAWLQVLGLLYWPSAAPQANTAGLGPITRPIRKTSRNNTILLTLNTIMTTWFLPYHSLHSVATTRNVTYLSQILSDPTKRNKTIAMWMPSGFPLLHSCLSYKRHFFVLVHNMIYALKLKETVIWPWITITVM